MGLANVTAIFKALVGKRQYSNDQEVYVRAGRSGEVITAVHGKYYQATKDGEVFHAHTAGAGLALNGDAEGTTWDMALYNPAGSGVDLVILDARMARGTTGDIGPGAMVWMAPASATSTVPTGTAMAITNGYFGGGANNKAQALYTVTVEGTDGVRVRTAFQLSENLVGTAGAPAGNSVSDPVDGMIIVPPGWYVGLTNEGDAGSSPLVHASLSWKEVPV